MFFECVVSFRCTSLKETMEEVERLAEIAIWTQGMLKASKEKNAMYLRSIENFLTTAKARLNEVSIDVSSSSSFTKCESTNSSPLKTKIVRATRRNKETQNLDPSPIVMSTVKNTIETPSGLDTGSPKLHAIPEINPKKSSSSMELEGKKGYETYDIDDDVFYSPDVEVEDAVKEQSVELFADLTEDTEGKQSQVSNGGTKYSLRSSPVVPEKKSSETSSNAVFATLAEIETVATFSIKTQKLLPKLIHLPSEENSPALRQSPRLMLKMLQSQMATDEIAQSCASDKTPLKRTKTTKPLTGTVASVKTIQVKTNASPAITKQKGLLVQEGSSRRTLESTRTDPEKACAKKKALLSSLVKEKKTKRLIKELKIREARKVKEQIKIQKLMKSQEQEPVVKKTFPKMSFEALPKPSKVKKLVSAFEEKHESTPRIASKSRVATPLKDSGKNLSSEKVSQKNLNVTYVAENKENDECRSSNVECLSPINKTPSKASKLNTSKTATPTNLRLQALKNSTYVAENNQLNTSTPHQTSSMTSFCNYDMSELKDSDDDEDEYEIHQKKPIPAWSTGIRLKNAIMQQHYDPCDVESIFGRPFIDIHERFGFNLKQKRTSSAIWSTPDRPGY